MKRKGKGAPAAFEASLEAKRCAHAVLEVLSGLKGPSEGAQALSVSLPRYYVLEARGLEGLVKALEPRAKGKRGRTPESRLEEVTRERDRLKTELERMRSLVRVAQRTVGLPSRAGKGGEAEGKGRKRRKVNRTRKVLSLLAPAGPGPEGKKAEAAE